MLKLTPLLLALAYGYVAWRFSVWRTHRMLDAQSTPLVDPDLAPYLARLARALDVARIRVHLHEVAPVNGLAAPDGRIFITRGFYEKFRAGAVSGAELTGVIAHELGHVALGHTRRRMIDFSAQNALRTALVMVLGRLVPGLGVWLAGVLSGLLVAGLSRSDEYEADEYAAALMVKAGLGVAPLVSLFGKLEQLTGAGGGRPAWMSSHPETADRIARLRALEARWGG